MKVGFIGLGRMGSAMARRLIEGGHEVGVYNRTPRRLKERDRARRQAGRTRSRPRPTYGEAVFTMLADDAAVTEVVNQRRRPVGVAAQGRHSHLRRHA